MKWLNLLRTIDLRSSGRSLPNILAYSGRRRVAKIPFFLPTRRLFRFLSKSTKLTKKKKYCTKMSKYTLSMKENIIEKTI